MENQKIDILQKKLLALNPYAIAFSGGNDSTFLAAISKHFKMDFCLIHCISEFTIPQDTLRGRTFAGEHDIPYQEVNISVLGNAAIVTNNKDRCYYCKKVVFQKIKEYASQRGFQNVVDAGNVSDTSDYRPGRKALVELGIHSPLLEAGFTREDIIQGLQYLNIPFSKTSNSCLATRIPYGTAITQDMLDTIRRAEEFIIQLGFDGVRVRYHYPVARIEILIPDMQRIVDPEVRNKIVAFCKQLGFLYVTMDLEGFTSGNLNRMLDHE
ncbi:MAG: ATP-dependent sacrificial sulfur transferase LarE [Spirochaetota bacterium]